MGKNSSFIDDAKFLDAAGLAGKDVFVKVATEFGKSFCYITIPHVCDYFLRSEDASELDVCKSVLLTVSPLKAVIEDQLKGIRKCREEEEGVLRQVNYYSCVAQFKLSRADVFDI